MVSHSRSTHYESSMAGKTQSIEACFIDPCGEWVDKFLDRTATCIIYPTRGLDFFYNGNFRRHQPWETCASKIRVAVNNHDCHRESSLYKLPLLDNYHQHYYYASKLLCFDNYNQESSYIHSFTYSYIHPVVCLTIGPKSLPKPVLHRVKSSASSLFPVSSLFDKVIQ